MQSALMLLIALACCVSAADWFNVGNPPAALAFIGFGLGYIGLAWLFA